MVLVLKCHQKKFCKRGKVIIFQSSSQMSFLLQNFLQSLRGQSVPVPQAYQPTNQSPHQPCKPALEPCWCGTPVHLLASSVSHLLEGWGCVSFLSMLGMVPGRAGSASTALAQLKSYKAELTKQGAILPLMS